ncbi:hypothetical protein L195_g053718, partial [Trifolium pratense]
EVNLWQSLEHKFHQSGSFSSIIFSTISSMKETKQSLFAAVLWSIWRARNECIWENKQANLMTSGRLASYLIRDFNWCRNMLDTDPTSAHVLTWKKPFTNWLKCNVDGAIFMTGGKFGIATAMKHALALALSNGFERVIFESDYQQFPSQF